MRPNKLHSEEKKWLQCNICVLGYISEFGKNTILVLMWIVFFIRKLVCIQHCCFGMLVATYFTCLKVWFKTWIKQQISLSFSTFRRNLSSKISHKTMLEKKSKVFYIYLFNNWSLLNIHLTRFYNQCTPLLKFNVILLVLNNIILRKN